MGTFLIERIQQAQAARRIISLHTSSGTTFLGYVLSVNPEVLLLRSITRQGLLTAVRSLRMDDVVRVDFDDRYIRLVEFKENNPEIAVGQPTTPDGLANEYLTIPVMLRLAREAHQLVFVETTGEYDFYGYVAGLSDDEVLLNVYTQYGEADGQTVFGLDYVRSVVWSDEITRTIELLLRERGPRSSSAG